MNRLGNEGVALNQLRTGLEGGFIYATDIILGIFHQGKDIVQIEKSTETSWSSVCH